MVAPLPLRSPTIERRRDPETIGPGVRLYGAACAALGAIDLGWGGFATVWQPVPPDAPGLPFLAAASASLLVAGGVAVQFPRSVRDGAIALCAPFAAFSLLWAKRVVLFPSIFATWSGAAEELSLLLAAAELAARGSAASAMRPSIRMACRLSLAMFLLSFGVAHFVSLAETAAMVPPWIPGGGRAWAVATGVADVLAALAIASGRHSRLAAVMVAAMYVAFAAVVWLPMAVARPFGQVAWAGVAVTHAIAGAVLVVVPPEGAQCG